MSLPLFDTMPRASREAFERFDADHPEVYREFCRIAKVLRDDRGYDHYSADGVMHVVRFHTRAGADTSRGFKINNNHVAFYARKLIAEDQSFSTFFRTRKQRRAG